MTIADRMSVVDNKLDEFEVSIGLEKYELKQNDINKYLNMTREQLDKLAPEDCGEISFMLIQFALHLQRSINREASRKIWAASALKKIITKEASKYQGYWTERENKVILHDEAAAKLNQIRVYAEMREERLKFLATTIKDLVKVLEGIRLAKGK